MNTLGWVMCALAIVVGAVTAGWVLRLVDRWAASQADDRDCGLAVLDHTEDEWFRQVDAIADAYDGADDGEPGIPDPTPPGDVLVPYGKSGVLVHRRCAQDRVAACEWCARVLGRTKAVAP